MPVLRTVKSRATGPILIHVITKKGKGYHPAENAGDRGHGVSRFDIVTGEQADELDSPGTIVGEISAISHTAATATVTWPTEVQPHALSPAQITQQHQSRPDGCLLSKAKYGSPMMHFKVFFTQLEFVTQHYAHV